MKRSVVYLLQVTAIDPHGCLGHSEAACPLEVRGPHPIVLCDGKGLQRPVKGAAGQCAPAQVTEHLQLCKSYRERKKESE